MGGITLSKASDDYKTVYMPYRNFAERTRVEYLNDLKDLVQFFEQHGIKEVKDIGLPQFERYLAELDHRGIAGSTRKRKVVSIRSFLSYLYQDGYINTNLAKRLIPPFEGPKSPRYLTKLEYERLLEAASRNPRDFALIQLLLQTGIKLSELTHLTLNDVEIPSVLSPETKDVGYFHVRGSERRKGRVLPLNYKACLAIQSYLPRRIQTTVSALFINRFGQPLHARGVEKIVNKHLREVGIMNASVQSLRHTFGVHQAISGADAGIIQEIMGHKDSRTTSRYFTLAKGITTEELVRRHALWNYFSRK